MALSTEKIAIIYNAGVVNLYVVDGSGVNQVIPPKQASVFRNSEITTSATNPGGRQVLAPVFDLKALV